MATIDDVAREAGVSKSTVSRVILGGNKVKPKTQQAVMYAIQTLNYTPNTAARSLALRRSGNIAVISGYMFNDPFYSIVAEEVYNACLERGYNTLFFTYRVDKPLLKDPCDIFHGTADGFIYLGDGSVSLEQLAKARGAGLSAAVFKTGLCTEGLIEADIDNEKGAYDGTQYLISQGHHRIALVHGGLSFYETVARIKGYRRALAEHGIAPDERLMVDCEFSYRSALERAGSILEMHPSAVFCLNDTMAYGLIRGMHNQGCVVPRDVSVLGFDDITFQNYDSFIELTTVHQPVLEMGRYMANAVMDQVETGVYAGKKVFPTQLIERQTVQTV